MDAERLEYLFGPNANEVIDDFDLAVESDRIELVERYLALTNDAPHRDARMAMRTVVVTQILQDDPPETWQTVKRLRDAGIDREEVLSQLAMVNGEQLRSSLASRTTFDRVAYVATLASLPFPTPHDIEQALIDVVRQHPGITVADHVAAVQEALGSPSRTTELLVDSVLDQMIDGPLHWLPGDATVYVPEIVDGATFTHRLSSFEQTTRTLHIGFDAGAFTRFDVVSLPDGTVLEQISAETGVVMWRGPEGWLDGYRVGALLAITASVATGDDENVAPFASVVAIEGLEVDPEETDAALEAVSAGYEALVAEPGLPVSGEELSLWLCANHRPLFDRPQPPLEELCAAVGLERRAGSVAADDVIWRRDLLQQRLHIAYSEVPEPEWRQVIGRALEVLDDPDATVSDVRSALDDCAEPEVLDALASVLFPSYLSPEDEFDRDGADATGRLFDLVNRATTVARRPREVATAEYLACVLYERCAEPEIAESHLLRAVGAQPRLGPCVERMGWYLFDRGDARGAMKWWRELSELPHAAAVIEPFQTSSSRKLGRNDPCWCGSGRKFKQCHLNAAELPPLPDRVGWLARKAATWLEHADGEARRVVAELALAYATGDPDVDPTEVRLDETTSARLGMAFSDPMLFDAALNEDGLFDLFLRERGALLPDDEQLLAGTWQTVDRSVHEVSEVEPGVGLTLRDLATGDVLTVRERALSRDASVGERYCARVVPDGVSHQIVGSVFPVRTGNEEIVLDMCAEHDALALCAWAGTLQRPPQVVHTPGLIDDRFDRGAIEAALANLGDDTDESQLMAILGDEISRQARTRWLDDHVPALGGLTPRQAAADPTRREQLERLLAEFDRHGPLGPGRSASPPDGFVSIDYDVPALRRELGLD